MTLKSKIAGALLVGMMAANGPLWAQSNGRITVDEIQSELSEAYATIARYTLQERDNALSAVKNTLGQIDDEIEVLEQRARENWADMSDAARERTAETLQDLRARRNRLGEMYGALSHGTDAAWGELVSGLTRAWEAFAKSWEDAVENANASSEM
jgi:hypothetical protein